MTTAVIIPSGRLNNRDSTAVHYALIMIANQEAQLQAHDYPPAASHWYAGACSFRIHITHDQSHVQEHSITPLETQLSA